MKVPPGWVTTAEGLPDMLYRAPNELTAGYEGELWSAIRGAQELQVRWMGNHSKYICRAFLQREDTENPTEARNFDYPHEVVDWLAMWFQNMNKA